MAINLRNESHWFSSKYGPEYATFLMEDGTIETFNYRTEGHRWQRWNRKDEIVAKWWELKNEKGWSVEYVGPRGNTVYEHYDNIDRETCQNMMARKALREAIEREIQNDPKRLLERTLRQHDWYYFYSDDGAVYNGGSRNADKIFELEQLVPVEVAVELWNKYCPWAKEEPMTAEMFNRKHAKRA